MPTHAIRRRPFARRAIRGLARLPRVTRAMREPWHGPRPDWVPIVCRPRFGRRRAASVRR